MNWLKGIKNWFVKKETNKVEDLEDTIAILNAMTKKELDQYGQTIGLKIDRRFKKKTIINNILDYLGY